MAVSVQDFPRDRRGVPDQRARLARRHATGRVPLPLGLADRAAPGAAAGAAHFDRAARGLCCAAAGASRRAVRLTVRARDTVEPGRVRGPDGIRSAAPVRILLRPGSPRMVAVVLL